MGHEALCACPAVSSRELLAAVGPRFDAVLYPQLLKSCPHCDEMAGEQPGRTKSANLRCKAVQSNRAVFR
jgi:hypothetical protein